jgi:hypothetical protein
MSHRDTAMRRTRLEFEMSQDDSMVRATIDGVTVITAMLYGHVDGARKARIGRALTALAIECLECVPVDAARGDDKA